LSQTTADPTQVSFGIYVPQVALGFEELLARAQRCEALGITSFWLYDHLYAPGLPAQDALEAWTLATGLLMRTTTLRVGHLVIDNNLRHPAVLGKMATTLDVMSGGRLELGIGSGSYEEEHRQAGLPWGSLGERSERLAEALEILTRMFSGEPTTFSGSHYQVRDLPNRPAPAQSPRPPLHIGGIGATHTLPLVARYADVWNVPTYGLARWRPAADALDRACDDLGRDPASLRRSLEAVLVLAEDEVELARLRPAAERRYPGPGWGLEAGGFVGTPETVAARIRSFVELGFTTFVFFPSDRGAGRMLELLASEAMVAARAG
jgi:alkanesulfonate monooxygenase SsuD/methylene tetrahydromethanopterin reductase-like flavin-dependent oxidoreductase (luciferase family)